MNGLFLCLSQASACLFAIPVVSFSKRDPPASRQADFFSRARHGVAWSGEAGTGKA